MLNENIDVIINKVKELCESILENSLVKDYQYCNNYLINNSEIAAQYDALLDMEDDFTKKESQNIKIDDNEIKEYDKYFEELQKNETLNKLFNVQNKIHNLTHIVNDFIIYTIENGKVPTIEKIKNIHEHNH